MDNYAKQVLRDGRKGQEAVKGGEILFFDTAKGPPPATFDKPWQWALANPLPYSNNYRLVGEDSDRYRERTGS